MDSSYVIPFVKSVQNVFETMLQLPVQVGDPELRRSGDPAFDVSGIIGMSGDVDGSVVLSFPTATAERVVSLLTGEQMSQAHQDFADAIGELVNMVSGGAKAQFVGKNVSISCPSVVIGSDHVVFGRKDVMCIRMQCVSDCGDFSLEVSFRNQPGVTPDNNKVAAAGRVA